MTKEVLAALLSSQILDGILRVESAVDSQDGKAWKSELANLDEFEALIGLINDPDPESKVQ